MEPKQILAVYIGEDQEVFAMRDTPHSSKLQD